MRQKEGIKKKKALCPFCEQLSAIKSCSDYDARNNPERAKLTEHRYKAALVHERYYNGRYSGRTVYEHVPLRYCPACGCKKETGPE